MRPRFEKPRIREERGWISSVAFIKFAFRISRSHNWNIHARLFEEECFICHFLFKRMSFTKFKDYPFTLENSQKTGLFCLEATFNSDFLETYTDFQISTHGKWKIDLFLNRIRLNFENRWTRTTIPFSLKILSLNKFQNGASCPCELLFWSPRLNNNSCQDYNNTLFSKTTQH